MNREIVINKDVGFLTKDQMKYKVLKDKCEKFLLTSESSFKNMIKGISLYGNEEENIVTLYGNNSEIIGYDEELIIISFIEFRKFLKENKIGKLIKDIKDGLGEFEVKVTNYLNKVIWLNVKVELIDNKKGNLKFQCYLHNITEHKENINKINHFKNRDELTGLNNRKRLNELVKEKLLSYSNKEYRSALLIIDLDNFKLINDSYGHLCGDELLKRFAEDLKTIVKDENYIGRFGGDEFLIFLSDIESLDEINKFNNRVEEMLKKPYVINNNTIYITVSIGIGLFPDDGEKFETLLKSADAAMYKAKSDGKNQWKMFNNNISKEISRIYLIQKGLRKALDENEIYVVYQPKISLKNNEVNGFEALVRWNSKEIGFVSPGEFIPIAENTKLIIKIGKFVLREVFKKVKYLIDEGYDNFKIAVNLSEIQLREGDLFEYFNSLVNEFKISSKYIEVEITESMIMKSIDKNIEYLQQIRNLGTSIALDDFGTGYSSLNHLTKLPIDVLKIDRSFIKEMTRNKKNKYVVENIIELSHKLNIEVVAEGVEELRQVEYLEEMNCDMVQGFYFSRPENFDEIIEMLKK